MEQDPFSRINPESSPESRDKDSDYKKEKKSSKSRSSFMDELLEHRNAKEKDGSDKDGGKKETREEAPTKKELAKEFLDHKADELRDEIENHTTLEQAAEAQADLELVEAISEKIDDPDKEVEPAVEEAYAELMDAMAEIDDAESSDESLDTDAETDGDSEETPDDSSEEDDATSTQPSATTPVTTSTGSSGSSGGSTSGGSSGGTTPPPTPPAGSPPPQPPRRPVTPLPPAGAVPPPPQPNFNAMPASSNPESATDQRRRVAGKMIVAGAVGYMIGRRGGRKRTEAKLDPEIKKRDETILDLKKDIEAKEASIRLHARQEATPKPEPEAIEKPTHESSSPAPVEKEPEDSTNEKESVIAQASPEGEQAVQKTAEKPQADQQLVVHEHQLQLEKEKITDHIETVSTPALLQIAEKITVLDTTVKKLYDTNQIDRKGLEEIVKEHLAGHDIGPVLDRRLLGKEAILERAHEYRHDPDADDAKAKMLSDESAKEPAGTAQNPIHDVKPFQPGAFNANMEPSAPEQAEEAQPAEIAHEQAQKALNKKHSTANIAAIAVIAIIVALLAVRILFM